jgi:hypothetical protein
MEMAWLDSSFLMVPAVPQTWVMVVNSFCESRMKITTHRINRQQRQEVVSVNHCLERKLPETSAAK